MHPNVAIRESEALSPLEVHLSRELSRLNRDLAFLQRYRHARADRLATRASSPHAEMDAVMAQLEAQAREFNRKHHLENERDPEDEDPNEEANGSEGEQGEGAETPLLTEDQAYQRLRAKSTEQTQSEDAEEPPKPDDGSSDLT